MRKKQCLVLILCLVFFVMGALVFFFLKGNDNFLPTKYKEDGEEQYITYGDKTYKYNEHLSNYLFMGIDTREPVDTHEGQSDAGRSDAILLVSYDRVDKTIRCLSIPRDTMANVHVMSADGVEIGTTKVQITTQYAYGDGKYKSCELMKQTVSETLYGIPIQGYCSVNMDAIPIAVEQIGEVEVVVPNTSLEQVNPIFKEGATVSITKDNTETFVRYRDINQDFSAMDRLERQKVFSKAFAEKAREKAEQDTKFVTNMYESLEPYMVTNIENSIFVKLAEAGDIFSGEIQDIPGEKVDGIDFDEYHINETQLYELILEMFYEEVQGE